MKTILALILAAFSMVLFFNWLAGSPPKTSSGASTAGSAQTTANSLILQAQKYPYLGEPFAVGYWSYVVQSADWRPYVAELGRVRQPDSGTFLIVTVSVRNNDRTESTRPPFKLLDDEGREFSESDFWSDDALSNMQMLNPGVAKSGQIFFDAPRGHYLLKVSGGYESGGKSTLVNLSLQPQSRTWVDPYEAPSSASVARVLGGNYSSPNEFQLRAVEIALSELESEYLTTTSVFPNVRHDRRSFLEGLHSRPIGLQRADSGLTAVVIKADLDGFCGSGGCLFYVLQSETSTNRDERRFRTVLKTFGKFLSPANTTTDGYYDLLVDGGSAANPLQSKCTWNGSHYNEAKAGPVEELKPDDTPPP